VLSREGHAAGTGMLALKFLPRRLSQDPKALERFQRRRGRSRRSIIPNIARCTDVGEHEGQPYLGWNCWRGQSLKERLERGPLPVREWWTWASRSAKPWEPRMPKASFTGTSSGQHLPH